MKYLKSRQATQKAFNTIDRIAELYGKSPEYVATRIVENYVKNHGYEPAKQAAALALQVCLIHDNKVQDMQKRGIPDYYLAENALLQNQIEQEENGVDNFIGGSLLGSIFRSGDAALDAVNKKRLEKGKKPILSGKLMDKIRKNVTLTAGEKQIIIAAKLPEGQAQPKNDSEVSAAMKGINDSLTNDGKTDFLRENFLIIAIAFYGVIYLLSNQK